MSMGLAGRTGSLVVIALACVAALSVASHAQQRDAVRLPRVLVTVTRDAERSTYDLPYAITVVGPDSADAGRISFRNARRTERRGAELGLGAANVRIGGTETIGRSSVAPVFGVHNLFDRRYVSSVAVNATGGTYFEPAPGRILFVGLTLTAGG